MDIEVVEMTLVVALPTIPAIVEEGELQVARPTIFTVPRDLVITEVAGEKGTITMDPPAIEATTEVLLDIAKAWSSEAVGGTTTLAMASLLAFHVVARVLSTAI